MKFSYNNGNKDGLQNEIEVGQFGLLFPNSKTEQRSQDDYGQCTKCSYEIKEIKDLLRHN